MKGGGGLQCRQIDRQTEVHKRALSAAVCKRPEILQEKLRRLTNKRTNRQRDRQTDQTRRKDKLLKDTLRQMVGNIKKIGAALTV